MPQNQIIHLHRAAPDKPPEGQPCNGCGVCCASEPCPVGIVFSRKINGACKALTWSEPGQKYRCGVIVEPRQHLPRGFGWLSPLLSKLAHRYISAGSGCDASIETQRD